MKILWINTSNNSISFWRLEQMARYMFENYREDSPIDEPVYPHVEYFFNPESGIAWDHYIQHNDDIAKQISDNLESAFKHFDIIICQSLGYKAGLNRLLQLKEQYKKPLLMEIDDCFDEFAPSNHSQHLFRDHFNVQARQASFSDAIITTNSYLGHKLAKYNDRVYVLPNAVYKPLWIGNKPEKHFREYVDYAFVGAGSHDEDLKVVYKSIRHLLDEDYKFGVYYGSFRPEWLLEHPNLYFENWNYHISDYYQQLLSVNCGSFFAPLRDTEFNRCKSDIKIIEAQMCGKPILCSRVGPFVNHNKNYTCDNNKEDWVQLFRKHKDSKKQTHLTDKHKIESYSSDFLKYLKNMLE